MPHSLKCNYYCDCWCKTVFKTFVTSAEAPSFCPSSWHPPKPLRPTAAWRSPRCPCMLHDAADCHLGSTADVQHTTRCRTSNFEDTNMRYEIPWTPTYPSNLREQNIKSDKTEISKRHGTCIEQQQLRLRAKTALKTLMTSAEAPSRRCPRCPPRPSRPTTAWCSPRCPSMLHDAAECHLSSTADVQHTTPLQTSNFEDTNMRYEIPNSHIPIEFERTEYQIWQNGKFP